MNTDQGGQKPQPHEGLVSVFIRVHPWLPRLSALKLIRGQLALGLALIATFASAAESPAQKALTPFLDQYCLKCHDTVTQKGDREFESFTLPLTKEA
eukprot:gene2419-3027_t